MLPYGHPLVEYVDTLDYECRENTCSVGFTNKVTAQLSLAYLFVGLLLGLALSFAGELVPSFPAAFLARLGAVLDNTTPAACVDSNDRAHLTACNEEVRSFKYRLPYALTIVVGVAIKLHVHIHVAERCCVRTPLSTQYTSDRHHNSNTSSVSRYSLRSFLK